MKKLPISIFFSFIAGVVDTGGYPLREYLHEFLKKIEMAPMAYSGAQEELIHS
jgi:hypothetical protein